MYIPWFYGWPLQPWIPPTIPQATPSDPHLLLMIKALAGACQPRLLGEGYATRIHHVYATPHFRWTHDIYIYIHIYIYINVYIYCKCVYIYTHRHMAYIYIYAYFSYHMFLHILSSTKHVSVTCSRFKIFPRASGSFCFRIFPPKKIRQYLGRQTYCQHNPFCWLRPPIFY